MNVFDLPGPQFIVLYAGFIAALAAGIYAYLFLAGGAPGRTLGDPFQIACLRAGPAEAARLATVSLLHRHFLELRGDSIGLATGTAVPRGLSPLENAVAGCCGRGPAIGAALPEHPAVAAPAEAVRDGLVLQGLLRTPGAQFAAAALSLCAAVLVLAIGITKLELAVERGHRNVGFLIIAMIASLGLFAWLGKPRPQTAAGLRMLGDLERLLGGRRFAAVDGTTGELLLLAAMFGSAAAPQYAAALAWPAVPTRANAWSRSNNNCGSTSTGSCGSSSGCGGGGGCGGCGSG